MYDCMYVCMYVCMHACMHVCMYACMHACMYVCMYGCMYVCMYIHIYIYMFIFVYTFTYTYLYLYIYIHILVFLSVSFCLWDDHSLAPQVASVCTFLCRLLLRPDLFLRAFDPCLTSSTSGSLSLGTNLERHEGRRKSECLGFHGGFHKWGYPQIHGL